MGKSCAARWTFRTMFSGPSATEDTDRQSSRGQSTRVLGKQGEAEKSRLHTAEKRHGFTWTDLHAYKDKMIYPVLPTCMGVDELDKDISLCDSQFRGLDRCLEQGMIHEKQSAPYARMQICKSHWIKFNRCVNRRDDLILRSVRKWEKTYYSSLDEESRSNYLEDIDTKMRYFLYAASHTPDSVKKERLEANAQRCAMRQSALIKPRAEALGAQV